ncbi:MAG: NAD(P)-binding protein, partial [Solirubrobacteraceae bacterium]
MGNEGSVDAAITQAPRIRPPGWAMRALIVGGGIGGLATALALRQAGIRADVFEMRADPKATQ